MVKCVGTDDGFRGRKQSYILQVDHDLHLRLGRFLEVGDYGKTMRIDKTKHWYLLAKGMKKKKAVICLSILWVIFGAYNRGSRRVSSSYYNHQVFLMLQRIEDF